MMIRLFYHAWVDGHWVKPAADWLKALEESGLMDEVSGSMTITLVGERRNREAARGWFASQGIRVAKWLYADSGYEQRTLAEVHRHSIWADQVQQPHYVWYGHSKGARDASPINEAWRRSMLADTLLGWRECILALKDGADLVGPHWLTPEEWSQEHRYVGAPFFGGNHWWASTTYLARLEAPDAGSGARYDAETWVGSGQPRRVVDLRRGWPGFVLFKESVEPYTWRPVVEEDVI